MTLDSLLHDPAFRELVGRFVEELTERIDAIGQAARAGRTEEVARLAHQVRGAGGGYGFPELSSLAAEVESLAESGATEQLEEAIDRLSEQAFKAEQRWRAEVVEA